MNKLMGFVVLFASLNVFADSRFLDSKRMSDCGGRVELRQSENGDLALQFDGLNTRRCDTLRFYDVSSGRTLKTYEIQGTSYTLSQTHREALSDDCRVGFTVSGRYAKDDFNVVLNWCANRRVEHRASRQSYQLSNSGNCKLMENGEYSGRNVADGFCTGARGNDVVTYELSNKGNCKRMINGNYTGQNVSPYFCTVRF